MTDIEMLKAKRDALQEQYQAFGRALRDANQAVKDELRNTGKLWSLVVTTHCGSDTYEDETREEVMLELCALGNTENPACPVLHGWKLYQGFVLIEEGDDW